MLPSFPPVVGSMQISRSRFWATFLVGFIVTSNLNWGIAEFFLNDWAMPRFDGFMRSGDGAGAGANIAKMTFGFMLPLFVVAWLVATLDKPRHWATRGTLAATLVSIAAFYGTYTFISGWGNVLWWPLMVTATCDWVSLLFGGLLIGWMQTARQRPEAASRT